MGKRGRARVVLVDAERHPSSSFERHGGSASVLELRVAGVQRLAKQRRVWQWYAGRATMVHAGLGKGKKIRLAEWSPLLTRGAHRLWMTVLKLQPSHFSWSLLLN